MLMFSDVTVDNILITMGPWFRGSTDVVRNVFISYCFKKLQSSIKCFSLQQSKELTLSHVVCFHLKLLTSNFMGS